MYKIRIYIGLLVLLSFAFYSPLQAQTGSPVVNFSLKNLDTGNPVTPEQYKGQVLVLFFLGHN